MKIIFETTERIPTWALSYIINGDDSGLRPQEKDVVDQFLLEYANKAISMEARPSNVNFVPIDNPYFTWNPAFGLACDDVVDCDILILGEE